MRYFYNYFAALITFTVSVPLFSQTTFQRVYPTPSASVTQSGREVMPTSDGGYFIAGVTTKNSPNDSDLYMIKTNSVGDTLWTKSYGGSQPEYPYSMIASNDGNYFVLGFTRSFGGGISNIWLLKMDPNANVIWSQTYGGSGTHEGHEIIATSDGNFAICGESNGDMLLAKIDQGGNLLSWNVYGGGQSESAHSLKQAQDGGFVLLGYTFSSGAGMSDIYLVKTDFSGNMSWNKTYGGAYNDEGSYILANSDGTFTLDAELSSGSTLADLDVYVLKVDASGGVIWSNTYGGTDKDVTHYIQPTSDGGYVISCISRSFGWTNPNMWIVKTDGSGNTQWTRNFGSWYHDHSYGIKQTSDGGYIAVGHSEDSTPTIHLMLVKMDANGNVGMNEPLVMKDIRIYPNPTEGMIRIGMGNVQNEPWTSLKVSNSLGEVLHQEPLDPSSTAGEKTIDLKGHSPGIYFVSLQSAKGSSTQKVIVK